MSLVTRLFFVAAVALAPAIAQERDSVAVYRDFSLAQRMRVVCSHKHFGRIDDFVVELPSGRLTAAVVTMVLDKGTRTVAVPFDSLKYDPHTNLLQLGPCLEQDSKYPEFDATALKVASKPRGDTGTQELEGSMLCSRIAQSRVSLLGDAKGAAQGLTLELSRGHVAFVDVAVGSERAGDAELHPVPWSALRPAADGAADPAKLPTLALPKTKEVLSAAPNLVEIIVQDPLYRAKVYAFYEVPRPVFDTEG